MVSLARMTLMATSATAPSPSLRRRSRALSTLLNTPRPCVAKTSYRSCTISPTCRPARGGSQSGKAIRLRACRCRPSSPNPERLYLLACVLAFGAWDRPARNASGRGAVVPTGMTTAATTTSGVLISSSSRAGRHCIYDCCCTEYVPASDSQKTIHERQSTTLECIFWGVRKAELCTDKRMCSVGAADLASQQSMTQRS